ncbi:M56 family metallopeptidase [Ichthyenterobacterium magnum]|uniref:BlaR1 peptidase M56 n=1 Tax=Ichthyenterobacterium magnum TaxID=1230530 RepID=A0A420DES4_9FLAO|nr:M56 family metallopeptidase [Ichthyenterobacterium magnum]RKE90804.1 BlaR1 peptidase M56 [Ichthyenterobacterium magnum]
MAYLIKASVIIGIFYVCYKLFLQRETFFQSNRWFIIIGVITSFVAPLIIIPIYTYIEPKQTLHTFSNNIITTIESSETIETINWDSLFLVLYFLGTSILGARLLIQMYSLSTLIYRSNKYRSGKYIHVKVEDNISPFSFFNWVVYNPNQFNNNELKQIITHEKVHVNQYHSLDIILIEIATIVFWCNPLIWLYKKELQQNLEFIADNKAQQKSNCEKSYQHLLLKTSVPQYQLALTNNFYNSLIKNRIVMLHKPKSKQSSLWKYMFILPALALFLMSFNTKHVLVEKQTPILGPYLTSNLLTDTTANLSSNTIEEKRTDQRVATKSSQKKASKLTSTKQKTKVTHGNNDVEMVMVTKNASDSDLDEIKASFKKKEITIKFKSIKRNSDGEITAIKIEAKSKNSSTSYNVNSDETIEPIKIVFDAKNNNISIGNGHYQHGNNTFAYKSKGGKHKIYKSGKGNNVFVFSDDDEHEHHCDEKNKHNCDTEHEHHSNEDKIIIRSNGKNGKHKKIKRSKNVQILSGDDDHNVVEVIVESDTDNEQENHHEDVYVIKNNGKSKVSILHDDDDNHFEIKTSDKGNLVFISDANEKPLFILDGKEISKKDIENINSDTIKKVEVLKGDKATEKYGKKGKDGVVLMYTKNKN